MHTGPLNIYLSKNKVFRMKFYYHLLLYMIFIVSCYSNSQIKYTCIIEPVLCQRTNHFPLNLQILLRDNNFNKSHRQILWEHTKVWFTQNIEITLCGQSFSCIVLPCISRYKENTQKKNNLNKVDFTNKSLVQDCMSLAFFLLNSIQLKSHLPYLLF